MTTERRTPPPPAGRRTVADLMTRDVVSVRSDAPIQDAVALLADSHVTGLAVIDGHGKLVGVVSASDVLAAEAEAGDTEDRARLLVTGVVADVMSPSPLTTSEQTDAREAALQMDYADVHRLFVVEDHRLIGVISRSDINRAFAAGRLP